MKIKATKSRAATSKSKGMIDYTCMCVITQLGWVYRSEEELGGTHSLVPRPHPLNGKGSGDIARFSWLC